MATNILHAPADHADPVWVKTGALVGVRNQPDPYGGNSAKVFVDDGLGGSGSVQLRQDRFGLPNLTRHTYWADLAPDQTDWAQVFITNTSLPTPPSIFINLSTGVIGTVSSTAENEVTELLDNSFYRCSFEFVTDAVDINVKPALRVSVTDDDSVIPNRNGTNSIIVAGGGMVKGVLYVPGQRPGIENSSGNRNRRVSRFDSNAGNDVAYRLGVGNSADVATSDNKHRNRFS